jgi:pimeloyl-ACP methyl ester carboxylesterase
VASLSAIILAAGAALVGCPQNPLAVGAGIISLGPPPADGQYADLGDYRIFYRQKGQGGTPVILMAGEDENVRIWNQVMDPIAQETTVIAYDRGGVGWSDDGYNPRNGTTIVNELRAFLQTINVDPPYVLVAHSLGGLYARLYAHKYPNEIEGILLIDTTHEDYYRRTALELTPQAVQTTQLLMGVAQSVVTINQSGALGEYYNIDNASAEVRANRSLPDVPLLLLSQDFDNLAPLDDAQEAIAVMLLQELYIDQSRLSSKGIWRPVQNTTHFIMNDQPQAVIDGVKEVLQGW